MQKILAVSFALILISCNNNGTEQGILDQEPYKILTDSIREFPKQAHLYYNRGTLLYKNDQKQLAETDIENAWSLSPKEEYALSLITIYRERNADTAIQFIQQAIGKLPENLALEVSLARGYQQKQDYQKALSTVDAILKKHQNQIDSRIIRYEVLKSLGREKEALTELETAVKSTPFDEELFNTLGFEYALSSDRRVLAFSDTLVLINNLRKNPRAEPYYFKAVYYHKTGQVPDAMRELETAIRTDYYFIDAHMEKGEILYETKKYPEAHKAFQLAATISPTYADAYYWLGKTEEAMGKKQEAKLNYQRAFGLDKTHSEAKSAADRL